METLPPITARPLPVPPPFKAKPSPAMATSTPGAASSASIPAEPLWVISPVNARGIGRWRRYAEQLAPMLAELETAGIVERE
jgi:hypothetical protein